MGQFLALFGLGEAVARFDLAWKSPALPGAYVTTLLSLILIFELLPYAEELLRCLRRQQPAAIGRSNPGRRHSLMRRNSQRRQ